MRVAGSASCAGKHVSSQSATQTLLLKKGLPFARPVCLDSCAEVPKEVRQYWLIPLSADSLKRVVLAATRLVCNIVLTRKCQLYESIQRDAKSAN